jgi:hypothetical protein
LSPLSESPSTSSLSLSPLAIVPPDNSAMHRIRFEELLQRAEVRFVQFSPVEGLEKACVNKFPIKHNPKEPC